MGNNMFSTGPAFVAYNLARKWLTLQSFVVAPVTFFVNAPFGRFGPKNDGIFVVDGRKAWMAMEIISPIMFIYTYVTAPLVHQNPGLPAIMSPQNLLATLFLIHYANRAIISPLRTPSRSKSHIFINFGGGFFNVLNGSMMGAYLSSPFTRLWFSNPYSTTRVEYRLGLALWAVGLIGNVVHDEILLNIRRKANAAGKSREKGNNDRKGEYYAIPYGLLYKYISYPNYFCEWIEWLGFALAAGPIPFHISGSSLSLATIISTLSPTYLFSLVKHVLQEPAPNFFPSFSPPWIFFVAEVILMTPRAYKGHQWYKERFGDSYPKERKIVIPFLL